MTDASGIVAALQDRGVELSVRDGNIHFEAPIGVIADAEIRLMRSNKRAFVDAILRTCQIHNRPDDYLDHPSRSGWIRSTCKRCGRFVGHRPRHIAEPKRTRRNTPKPLLDSGGNE